VRAETAATKRAGPPARLVRQYAEHFIGAAQHVVIGLGQLDVDPLQQPAVFAGRHRHSASIGYLLIGNSASLRSSRGALIDYETRRRLVRLRSGAAAARTGAENFS
jgi:hypothetical protein